MSEVIILNKKVTTYDITPVPKPRMTQRDKWKRRPVVLRYFAFKDQVRDSGLTIPTSGCQVLFIMPMAKSWSKQKKLIMEGQAHEQKPDLDNLLKALGDALFDDDSVIWDIRVTKVWGREGKIKVRI